MSAPPLPSQDTMRKRQPSPRGRVEPRRWLGESHRFSNRPTRRAGWCRRCVFRATFKKRLMTC